jgi:hypothetical protein
MPKKQEDSARKKEVKEEKKWRKNIQEVETQAQTVPDSARQCRLLTLGMEQITKFIYRLDGPLGEDNV